MGNTLGIVAKPRRNGPPHVLVAAGQGALPRSQQGRQRGYSGLRITARPVRAER